MNKAKLTALCHKISKNTGLTFNSVMTYYFLEVILKKLSQSSYSNHYIFKGGFLLSNVIGVESRSTVDIDFLFHQMTLSEDTVEQQLKEILADSEEGISFVIQSTTAIKESDDYGGYRATILCQLENIKQIIHLDIATGDIVTPQPITYDYKAIFNEDMIYAGTMAKRGYGIAYAADACVIHSHNYSCRQQFHRNFDLGVSQADHPEIFEGVPSEGEGLRLVKKSLAYLIKTGHIWLVPKLAGQSGFKYMGYFLGKRYHRLPKKIILKCTMNPRYWR